MPGASRWGLAIVPQESHHGRVGVDQTVGLPRSLGHKRGVVSCCHKRRILRIGHRQAIDGIGGQPCLMPGFVLEPAMLSGRRALVQGFVEPVPVLPFLACAAHEERASRDMHHGHEGDWASGGTRGRDCWTPTCQDAPQDGHPEPAPPPEALRHTSPARLPSARWRVVCAYGVVARHGVMSSTNHGAVMASWTIASSTLSSSAAIWSNCAFL
jgi:hypothetical protein